MNFSLKIYSYRYLCYVMSLMLLPVDYNLVIFLCIMSTFIFNVELTPFDYFIFFLIVVYKSQTDAVLASQDLEQYLKIYTDILWNMNSDVFDQGEIFLIYLFKVFGFLFGDLDKEKLSFLFVFICYMLSIFIAFRLNSAIISVCFILFLDVNLMVHLFRQYFASLVFLLTLLYLYPFKGFFSKMNFLMASLLSFFTHSTIIFLFFISIIQGLFSFKFLKIGMVLSFLCGLFLYPIFSPHVEQMLINFHGINILGKASYALAVLDGAFGFRAVAFLGIISMLLIFPDDLESNHIVLYKIIAMFFSLSLFFYNVPIISTRIGLVSTSILTGIPIGWWLLKLNKALYASYCRV